MIFEAPLLPSQQQLVRATFSWKSLIWIVLASLLGWTGWIFLRVNSHPFGDISNGKYSDHLTHFNCARVFPQVGVNLWRKPIDKMYVELSATEKEQLPDDVRVGASPTGGLYKVPGWPP